MKILGNRVLVSRLEEQKSEGFQTVEVQDSFVNKGKVEQIASTELPESFVYKVGDIILFAKYSPDTQEVEFEGKKMKVVSVDDILAIL